ncbi:MAG TPA: M12 family metallopeptidase [Ferruginibacter sp.]|nr:M12 family metallopeptidase [Ferruginibacter sp.]HRE64729.1 M12 family metallopeptidase [Ferruginibacter sp.]
MTRILLTAVLFSTISFSASAQHLGCSTKEGGDNKTKINFHENSNDTTKPRGLVDKYFLWDEQSTLKVKFLSGSPELQSKIASYAKEWEQFAGVKFNFVKTGDADIRIFIGKGNGHNSFIGTVAKQIDPWEQTMNLDSADFGNNTTFMRSTTLHEFGHALGLLHEHSSPVSGIQWDKKFLYKEYAKIGWTEEDVDYQVLYTYNKSYTNGTKYDNKSIMHYPIMPGETVNKYVIDWNHNLSVGDKALIKDLYPFTGKRKNDVVRVNMHNFGGISMEGNEKRKGLLLYPKFDLKTGGKGGPVKMIFKFYDEEGYGFQDEDGKYQENGTVSTMRTVILPANKTIKYNQNGKKDFEFFLPFDQIPEAAFSQNMIVTFKITYLTGEGELKNLYVSAPLQFRYKKK